jgi:tripartite-type tricarboxylate transporter receptor subunit TctC
MFPKIMVLRRAAWALPVVMLVIMGAVPMAQTADFYGKKTIDFLIGGNPGGGYDTYSRTIGRHLGRHIPGRPAVINKNMPGAGSSKLAAYIYAVAPKTGLVIGAIYPGAIANPLVNTKLRKRYEPTKLIYLASADSGTRLCFTFQHSKTKTFADAQKMKTVMGASAAGGSTRDYVLLHNALSGTKFELVSGYKGSVDIILAMERGEVDGLCGFDWTSFLAQRPQWLEQKKVNPLVQVALEPEDRLTKLGVPSIWEYIKGDEDRQVMRTVVAQQVFGRPYIAPPGTPADRVAILRAGFAAALKDPRLLADAKKARIEITPSSGEKVQQLVTQMYATPKPIVGKMTKILTPVGRAKKTN